MQTYIFSLIVVLAHVSCSSCCILQFNYSSS